MDLPEKASMRVNCVQFGCKWAVWYLCPGFSITGEEKKGGIRKWGKHDRCLKLGFTVPMGKQVHITRLGENDFC